MQVKIDKNFKYRSHCPISSALDIIGDKWSLLIIRDIMFGAKSTFVNFASSSEHIASNILAKRLLMLEEQGVLTKGKHSTNKKTILYSLTSKGIDLLPIIIEMILWSDKNLGTHVDKKMRALAKKIKTNKQAFTNNYSSYLKNNP